jgi:hypothetical protein
MSIQEIITASFGFLLTCIGFYISWRIHVNQKTLTEKISNSQELLAQRQLLVPLWGYISTLNEINPQSPIVPDVIKAVNTLELVALCCEGRMIDEKVIKRTFSNEFIKIYEQIEACQNLTGLNKSGKTLLGEAKSASLFYNKLKHEHLNSNAIT